jgi:glucose/arabinose dehydrogenase
MRITLPLLSCLAVGLLPTLVDAAAPNLAPLPVVTGLSAPLFVTAAPGDNTHLYIVEQGSGGTASVRVFDTASHTLGTFLTITGVATGGEQGLLGMAFDPAFQTSGKFYLNFTAPGGAFNSGVTNIVEYQASSATSASSATARTILTFDQPQTNHNGGWIGFSGRAGDATNLYIATGDGGNGNDTGPGHIEPGGNAQSNTSLLGKMLRIDVSGTTATTQYKIPAGNPFAGAGGTVREEIFAMGLRNPYRDSFDAATGFLYIGDVGQSTREEIDVQKNAGGGENFGWRPREGSIATPGVGEATPTGALDPILDYGRSPGDTAPGGTPMAGRTVIGGYVYRGSAIAGLQGTYLFGDLLGPSGAADARSEIFALTYDGTNVTGVQDLTGMLNPGTSPLIGALVSFGQDNAGELYMVDSASGTVFRIVAVPEPGTLLLLALGIAGWSRRRGCAARQCR